MTTAPEEITDAVVQSFAAAGDPRTKQLMQALVRHLHAFAIETELSEQEWAAGIEFLTATGHRCTAQRQEFILLSDTLGVSMVVDALNHVRPTGATENTVLGPFWLPEMPVLPSGASIARPGDGDPALITGHVHDGADVPIEGAVVEVWQNAANGLYSVQDADQPDDNLRGRFVTDSTGAYAFWGVRPTDYAVPDDGPVGAMLAATGRHPWRAAHLHVIVAAAGFEPVTTHIFDDGSRYLESDTVFGVKPSLVRHFEPHGADEAPAGSPAEGAPRWYSLAQDLVLVRAASPQVAQTTR